MSSTDSFTVGFGNSSRNSSRILNPPGGISSDIFGTNSLAHGPRVQRTHLQSSLCFGDAGQGAGEGGSMGENEGRTEGEKVYDEFPETSTRGVPSGSENTEVHSMTESEDEMKRADLIEAKQGDDSPIGYALDEHQETDISEARENMHDIPDKIVTDVHSTGNVQLPRLGSRNPITGYGIGEDDTREISSVGCDQHNDNSNSGRTTGKRMYNTYNQRSQEW